MFRAEFSSLHRYLHRRARDDAADDVAVETFASAHMNWDRFDQARPVRPWLYGIAANLVRRYWRDEQAKLRAYAKTGIDTVLALDDGGVVHRLDAQARLRELAAALADLRPEDRDVLLLHAWAELSDTEIAAALSLSLGTVKSRLHRTREQLQNRLADNGQSAANAVNATKEEGR